MYYRIFDTQTGSHMATGLNCQTKEEVKEELWDYYSPDREEIFLTEDINEVTLELLLEVGEMILEEDNVPFDDDFLYD